MSKPADRTIHGDRRRDLVPGAASFPVFSGRLSSILRIGVVCSCSWPLDR
jgi:hypothetical protein